VGPKIWELPIWCSGHVGREGSGRGVNPFCREGPLSTTPGNFKDFDISWCSLKVAFGRDKNMKISSNNLVTKIMINL